MKNLLRICASVIVFFLVLSCKKEESSKPLSAEEAKSILDNSTMDVTSEISSIKMSSSLRAISNLNKIETPFNNPLKSALAISDFNQLKNTRAIQESRRFDFNAAKGVWNYDPATRKMVKISAADKVIIHFPSDSSQMTINNAVFSINNYESQMKINTLNDTTYQIIRLSMEMIINSKRTLFIDFSADWNENGMPKMLDAAFIIDEYDFLIKYSKNALQYSLNTYFKKSRNTIFAVNSNVKYSSDSSKIPQFMDGFFQVYNVKIQGSANMDYRLLTAYKAADFNSNVHFTVVRASDGATIGTIRAFDEMANNKPVLVTYVVFSDGSKETSKKYLNNIVSKLNFSI